MTALWLAALLVSASPEQTPQAAVISPSSSLAASSSAPESVPSRSLDQWRTLVNDALKQTVNAKDSELDPAATLLLPLYQDLAADQKLRSVDRESLRQKVRERLLTVREKLIARIQKEQKTLVQQKSGGGAGAKNVEATANLAQQLADTIQMIQPAGWIENGGNGSIAVFPRGGNVAEGPKAQAANGLNPPGGVILAQQGPFGNNVQAKAPANKPPRPVDHGQALVDLIQSVIAPQSWDAQGGQGTIRYWAPGGALIIRQTEEGHQDLEDLVKQLRKN